MDRMDCNEAGDLLNDCVLKAGWSDRGESYADDIEWLEMNRRGEVPRAGVVLCSTDAAGAGAEALRELLKQSAEDFEILFVDAASSEPLPEALRSKCGVCVRLARDTASCRALNIGALLVRSPLTVFLGDGVVPGPGLIEAHLNHHDTFITSMLRGECTATLPEGGRPGEEPVLPHPGDMDDNLSVDTGLFFEAGGWDDLIRRGHAGLELTYRMLACRPAPQTFARNAKAVAVKLDSFCENGSFLQNRENTLRYMRSKFEDADHFLPRWAHDWSKLPLVPKGHDAELVDVGATHPMRSETSLDPETLAKRRSLLNLSRHFGEKGDKQRAERYRKMAEEAAGRTMVPGTAGRLLPVRGRRLLSEMQIRALMELLAVGAYDNVLAARGAEGPHVASILSAASLRKGDYETARKLIATIPSEDERKMKTKALELLPRLAEPLKAEPRVHLLILCHNREKELVRSFEQLANTDYRNYAVYVVDNGSSDATWERLQEAVKLFPPHIQVTCERLPTNLGRPGGHNWLLTNYDHSEAEYIAIGDDDLVSVPPAWLRDMLKTAELFPNAAAVGGKAMDPGLPPIVHAGTRNFVEFAPHELTMTNSSPQLDVGQFDIIDKVDHVIGCLHIYNRAMLFEEAGLFDIRFSPCQCVDIDHHLRIRLTGRDLIFNGFIRFQHMRAMGKKTATDKGLNGNSIGNMIKILAKYDHDEINGNIAKWRRERDEWAAE